MNATEEGAPPRQRKAKKEKNADGMMGIAQHLAELRDRLLRAVVAILLGGVAGGSSRRGYSVRSAHQ